jgi:hypothetical protein
MSIFIPETSNPRIHQRTIRYWTCPLTQGRAHSPYTLSPHYISPKHWKLIPQHNSLFPVSSNSAKSYDLHLIIPLKMDIPNWLYFVYKHDQGRSMHRALCRTIWHCAHKCTGHCAEQSDNVHTNAQGIVKDNLTLCTQMHRALWRTIWHCAHKCTGHCAQQSDTVHINHTTICVYCLTFTDGVRQNQN